jgi:hypothetical protein
MRLLYKISFKYQNQYKDSKSNNESARTHLKRLKLGKPLYPRVKTAGVYGLISNPKAPIESTVKTPRADERRRLLDEMISDGDVETIQDLIERLGVSRNTIKRDMAATGWRLNGDGFKRTGDDD